MEEIRDITVNYMKAYDKFFGGKLDKDYDWIKFLSSFDNDWIFNFRTKKFLDKLKREATNNDKVFTSTILDDYSFLNSLSPNVKKAVVYKILIDNSTVNGDTDQLSFIETIEELTEYLRYVSDPDPRIKLDSQFNLMDREQFEKFYSEFF